MTSKLHFLVFRNPWVLHPPPPSPYLSDLFHQNTPLLRASGALLSVPYVRLQGCGDRELSVWWPRPSEAASHQRLPLTANTLEAELSALVRSFFKFLIKLRCTPLVCYHPRFKGVFFFGKVKNLAATLNGEFYVLIFVTTD